VAGNAIFKPALGVTKRRIGARFGSAGPVRRQVSAARFPGGREACVLFAERALEDLTARVHR
jgi:hypothetical protein